MKIFFRAKIKHIAKQLVGAIALEKGDVYFHTSSTLNFIFSESFISV